MNTDALVKSLLERTHDMVVVQACKFFNGFFLCPAPGIISCQMVGITISTHLFFQYMHGNQKLQDEGVLYHYPPVFLLLSFSY